MIVMRNYPSDHYRGAPCNLKAKLCVKRRCGNILLSGIQPYRFAAETTRFLNGKPHHFFTNALPGS